MAKIKISEELPSAELEKYYKKAQKEVASTNKEYSQRDFKDLDYIFKVGCANRALFPTINMEKESTAEQYLERWILTYCQAKKHLASEKKASPKTTCSDPLIKNMIKQVRGIKDDEILDSQEKDHILFMAAENLLGMLLEEYIAKNIKAYGWVWCAGQTLNAIDFCNTEGTKLLQIKNKSNSENSSSKKVREGTEIKKWYRLGTSKKEGKNEPSYKWDKLNEFINADGTKNGGKKCEMTEEKFQKFVKKVIEKNPQILSEE